MSAGAITRANVQSLTPSGRSLVLKAFERDRPRPFGAPFEVWCEQISAEIGLTPNQIKRVIAEEEAQFLATIRTQSLTVAQKVANTMGVTMAKVMGTLNEAMEASKQTPLRNRSGEVLKDEQGEPIILDQPLHDVRVRAALGVAKILGMEAPHKIEIDGELRVVDMPDQELMEQLEQVYANIGQLKRDLVAATHGSATTRGRIDVASSASRQVVLADPVHEDG